MVTKTLSVSPYRLNKTFAIDVGKANYLHFFNNVLKITFLYLKGRALWKHRVFDKFFFDCRLMPALDRT